MEDDQEQRTGAAPRVYETSLRVRYAETDQMGVVYHSNYIVWFEVGRVEMLRDLGFHYREMEKQDGTHIAVVEVRCRFKSPALYDDLITIRTRLLNVRESLLHFGYEVIRSNDGTLLAEGETIHLVVDGEFKRIRLPEKYLQPFLQAAGKNMGQGDEAGLRNSVAH
ncbi:MAG: thioesterase family protein [Candidatus Korobacteraceae bacterium]